MAFVKPVLRVMPGGEVAWVSPFHISFEGLERNIICRDDEDCDTLVKCIFVCSWRKNVIVIIYAVVSNHAHIAALAKSLEDAQVFAMEVKRTYSLLFRRKYGEAAVLRRTSVDVQALDTDWYLRNALAYIPRNALDNGVENVEDYKWTGFRAFFRKRSSIGKREKVRDMSYRRKRQIMHTGDDLNDVPWEVNDEGEIIPDSACDVAYLEDAFNNDVSYFYRAIGGVNVAEMNERIVYTPRRMKFDAEFLKEVENISCHWFSKGIAELAYSQKCRLIPYIDRTMKTSVNQLARVFKLPREDVRRILRKEKAERSP